MHTVAERFGGDYWEFYYLSIEGAVKEILHLFDFYHLHKKDNLLIDLYDTWNMMSDSQCL